MTSNEYGTISTAREKLHVEWKIGDYFSQSVEKDHFLESPTFHSSNGKWFIQLYPNGQTSEDSVGYVGIYLCKCDPEESEEPTKIRVSYILGIRLNNGGVYESAKRKQQVFIHNEAGVYGSPNLIKASKLLEDRRKVESESFVTVFCIICFPDKYKNASQQSSLDNDISILSRNLKSMFEGGDNSDVTIKVKGKDFRAHVPVLASRSPVFASMFSHDTKEKRSGRVDINDCDPEVFREFLVYVYSGQTENISSSNVTDLYCTAEKYDFQELKLMCSDYMEENLSVDNICVVISLAIQYTDTELLACATKYFVENAEKIIVTVQWISFAKKYHVESNELILKTFKHLSSRKM